MLNPVKREWCFSVPGPASDQEWPFVQVAAISLAFIEIMSDVGELLSDGLRAGRSRALAV